MNMINPLLAIVRTAATLPETGMANNYQHRLGSGNNHVRVILLDRSGSMEQYVGNSHDRRIDILRQAIEKINWQNYRLFAFDSDTTEVNSPDLIPEPRGSTNLDLAIDTIVPLHPCETLIVCDGEVDDETATLAAAAKLSGIISCLYIGDDKGPGVDFMRQLAKIGCGKIYVQDITQGAIALGRSIERLMLPEGEKKGKG
jgi:hypothetical protein